MKYAPSIGSSHFRSYGLLFVWFVLDRLQHIECPNQPHAIASSKQRDGLSKSAKKTVTAVKSIRDDLLHIDPLILRV